MRNRGGVILYDGPSELDGSPIVMIATFRTRNVKTGNAIQTWIIRSDKNPYNAIHDGSDSAICGSCPLRGVIKNDRNFGRSCYVAVHNAPNHIYKAYKSGSYEHYSSKHSGIFAKRVLRLGSYGDPVAVPLSVLLPIIKNSLAVIGYTHQWEDSRFVEWQNYLMASVQSESGRLSAKAMGWRTFRMRLAGSPLMPGEFVCPASPEGGDKMDCSRCLACSGGRPEQASPVIIAHGPPTKLFTLTRLLA